jgi:hypothetical protein
MPSFARVAARNQARDGDKGLRQVRQSSRPRQYPPCSIEDGTRSSYSMLETLDRRAIWQTRSPRFGSCKHVAAAEPRSGESAYAILVRRNRCARSATYSGFSLGPIGSDWCQTAARCSPADCVALSFPSRSSMRPARLCRAMAAPTWFGRAPLHAAVISCCVLPVASGSTWSPRLDEPRLPPAGLAALMRLRPRDRAGAVAFVGVAAALTEALLLGPVPLL